MDQVLIIVSSRELNKSVLNHFPPLRSPSGSSTVSTSLSGRARLHCKRSVRFYQASKLHQLHLVFILRYTPVSEINEPNITRRCAPDNLTKGAGARWLIAHMREGCRVFLLLSGLAAVFWICKGIFFVWLPTWVAPRTSAVKLVWYPRRRCGMREYCRRSTPIGPPLPWLKVG